MGDIRKCKCCKDGWMYRKETHVHVVDSMMVKGHVFRCGRCGEVEIVREAYTKVNAPLKAKIGL